MKALVNKIRYAIVSLLLLNLTIHLIFIFYEYSNMTIIGYINGFPYAVLTLLGVLLLIFNKKRTDFITLIIFIIGKVVMITDCISYCQQKNLDSIRLCSEAVIPIVFGRNWIEDSFQILSIIAIVFLTVVLFKKTKSNYK
jgi:hypothetical protein